MFRLIACVVLGVVLMSDASTSGQTGPESPIPPAIVPQPVEMRSSAGVFRITPATPLVAAGEAVFEARMAQDVLAPAMGFRLPLLEGNTPQDGAIVWILDDALVELGDEGYRLDVTTEAVVIRASKRAGLFYGLQTLRQLLPPDAFRQARVEGVAWVMPCVSITDYPRFQWRGLLLSTAHHFVPKSAVLRFIDMMALDKFNRLQLHLTNNTGWRIEIHKYPKLTEIGAWRDETLVGSLHDKPHKFDGRRHGGYYTQEDIREIVRYAADRHITIVPGIEMPGHARAALASYPELGCHPEKQLTVRTLWGPCPDIFNPSDETIRFFQNVLLEYMEMFPGQYIHIGGDEVIKDQWKASPSVQARIRELGLKDEVELQSWFIRQMDTFLTRHGRRVVGWDEILDGGLAPGAVVMSWRGEAGGIAAAQKGHDVVMAPYTHTYFDHYQGPRETEPLAQGGLLPLEKVYAYEPIPAVLNEHEGRHILGAQGQLWTEYIPNPRHLEYMAYPRAIAFAEVLWSPKQRRAYDGFLQRLERHLERLKVLDVNYRPLDSFGGERNPS